MTVSHNKKSDCLQTEMVAEVTWGSTFEYLGKNANKRNNGLSDKELGS